MLPVVIRPMESVCASNPSIVSSLYENPPCLNSCAPGRRYLPPEDGIPSLPSRNSRICQGWKTALISPMLRAHDVRTGVELVDSMKPHGDIAGDIDPQRNVMFLGR